MVFQQSMHYPPKSGVRGLVVSNMFDFPLFSIFTWHMLGMIRHVQPMTTLSDSQNKKVSKFLADPGKVGSELQELQADLKSEMLGKQTAH